MTERQLAFRVGVVVVAAATLAVMMIGFFGSGKSVFKSRYTIYLRFPRAPGVTVNTPVRKNGVHIGRVTDVALERDHVVLTAMIDSNREIMKNEVCTISTSSILGDPILEFVPSSDKPATDEAIGHEAYLADGIVATDPLQVLTQLEGDIRLAMAKFSNAATDVSQAAQSLNRTLGSNDQQIQRIMAKSELALDSFQKTMATLDDVMGDPQLKQALKQSLADLPQTLNQVKQTMGQAQIAMERFERVGAKAETNLDNLAEFTRPLGENGERLVNNIDRSLANLEEVMSQLAIFGEALNNEDGTLGRLLNDDEMYDEIKETVSNINNMSRRVEPILRDVRIITDKISVDPRILGAKGALDQRPAGVGRKWPDTGIPFNRQQR